MSSADRSSDRGFTNALGTARRWILPTALVAGMTALPVRAQQNMPYPPAASGGSSSQAAPAAGPSNFEQAPPTLVIPAGTVVSVRTSQYLSSDQSHAGDLFDMTLDQPIVVEGWVVARRGQSAYGRVTTAVKAKAGGGRSRLGVELSQLTLVDGQQVPVETQFSQAEGAGRDAGQSIATVGTTTGIGAIIGAAANGGEGAGIGAAAGAAAGVIGVLLTPGKQTVIPEETRLSFQLLSPVSVSTVRSQVAFQPVSQQDYAAPQSYDRYRGRAPRHIAAPPPRRYCCGGWGYYPYYAAPYRAYPTFRFHGFYGPRVTVVRPRFGHRTFRHGRHGRR